MQGYGRKEVYGKKGFNKGRDRLSDSRASGQKTVDGEDRKGESGYVYDIN